MKQIKKIILWAVSIFFIMAAMVFFPSLTSILALLVVGIVIPLPKWQAFINRFVKGNIKKGLAVFLALLSMIVSPNTSVDNQTATDNTLSTIFTETSTVATTESTFPSTTEIIIVETEESTIPNETQTPTEQITIPTLAETNPTTEPVHVHSFTKATCTTPKTCSCGETEGTANGHKWSAATCINPKTCDVCSETEGSTTSHAYSNGKCSVCGQADPNAYSENLVWIPTKGGKKYHTRSSCSNMDDPEQVTQEEAERRGYTPCKRCH